MTHPFFEELQDEMKQSPLWQSAEKANQLQEILDACEAANAKHLARINHLESLYWKMWGENEKLRELCRDMYVHIDKAETHILLLTKGTCKEFHERMEQLGLLEGSE